MEATSPREREHLADPMVIVLKLCIEALNSIMGQLHQLGEHKDIKQQLVRYEAIEETLVILVEFKLKRPGLSRTPNATLNTLHTKLKEAKSNWEVYVAKRKKHAIWKNQNARHMEVPDDGIAPLVEQLKQWLNDARENGSSPTVIRKGKGVNVQERTKALESRMVYGSPGNASRIQEPDIRIGRCRVNRDKDLPASEQNGWKNEEHSHNGSPLRDKLVIGQRRVKAEERTKLADIPDDIPITITTSPIEQQSNPPEPKPELPVITALRRTVSRANTVQERKSFFENARASNAEPKLERRQSIGVIAPNILCDPKAQFFWRSFGYLRVAVPWVSFEEKFSRFSNRVLTPIEWDMLQYFLDPNGTESVALSQFGHYLHAFGTLESCTTNTKRLMQERCFHGTLAEAESTSILEGQESGSFLLYFNPSGSTLFGVAYITENGIRHIAADKDPATPEMVQVELEQGITKRYPNIMSFIDSNSQLLRKPFPVDASIERTTDKALQARDRRFLEIVAGVKADTGKA